MSESKKLTIKKKVTEGKEKALRPQTAERSVGGRAAGAVKTASDAVKAVSKKAAAEKHPVAETKQRLRIKVRAYDNKVADSSIKQIVEIAERYGAEVIGPVPLPTEIRKYTVNRSTFVHKNAREQFEMRVHKRLLDIINPTAKAIDSLMNLNLPAGVDIEVKM